MAINQEINILGDAGIGGGGGGGSGDATSIQGVPVSSDAPDNGDVLTFNGSVWIPLPVSSIPLTGPLLQQVRNESGFEILYGTPVYINSASTGLPLIEPASSLYFDESRILGVTATTIANNANGEIVKSGIATVNTTTLLEGDIVYLGIGNGTITNVRPMGAEYPVVIGVVTVVGVSGEVVVEVGRSQYTAETVTPLGWQDFSLENIDITFVNGTRTLTVAHSSEACFTFYEAGIKYCIDNGDPQASIQISDTEGLHVVYYDEGAITDQANPNLGLVSTLIRTKPLVCYIYWDVTNQVHSYLAKEVHQFKLGAFSHSLWHFNVGATWQGGLSLGDFTLGNGSLDTHAQFSTTTGFLSDEDLFHTIAPYGVSEGIPVFYREGVSAWRRDVITGFSVKSFVGGSGRLAYNEFTGGVWQQTEIINNDYVLCHVFATNDELGKGLFALQGQADYATLPAARQGATTEINNLVLRGFLVEEYFPVATVIFQSSTGYTNSILARIVESSIGVNYVNWLTEDLGPGSTPSSHLNLTDINGGSDGDGGHLVFPKLDGRTGGQTLNGGTGAGEDLTLVDNAVDANSITLTEIIEKVDGPITSTDEALARYNGTDGSEIQNSLATLDDSGNFVTPGTVNTRDMSADGTKLDGIEAGADVTDATNVANAGAIMETIINAVGDLIYGNGVDSATIIPIGTPGQALVVVGGIPSWQTLATGGDVVGPASATDTAVALFDTTTGKLLQDSLVLIDASGNITTPGTVDGRDVAADGTKLDGIEAGADVTDATNVGAAGAEFTANKDVANGYAGLDASSKLDGTQQVYGELVNTACEGNDLRLSNPRAPTVHALDGIAHTGTLDHTSALTNVGTNTHAQVDTHIAASNPHSGSVGSALITAIGDLFYGDAVGSVAVLPIGGDGQTLGVSGGALQWTTPAGGGDVTGPASSTDNAITAFDGVSGKLLQNTLGTIDASGNISAGAYNGRDVATDGTKLDGIEAGADVTDATNVANAGAIMQTIVDAAGDLIYGTAADTASRLPIGSNGQTLVVVGGALQWSTPAGGGDVVGPASATDTAIALFDGTTGKLLQDSLVLIDASGNITTPGTVDGRDVAADGTKLDGIEAGADVTDATNVGAAGAEFTANKNTANGYAGLDASSKLDGTQQVYGSTADTACEGDDSRLSDDRDPTTHALDGAAHSGTLDHTSDLTNVGTNTHAQIDTHIAAANPHSGSLGNVVEDTTPQLGGDLDLNQNSIVLDGTPTADTDYNGLVIPTTVDENTQGFGNALHLDTDGNWIDAHADAAATMPCRALACASGTGSRDILLRGIIRDDSWTWTVGGAIYVSDTASGGLTQTVPDTSGDIVQIVGYALSADVILFDPDNTFLELT